VLTQKFIGKTCPFCQFPLKADSEAVECPSCKVPHHRECWEQNGGCTIFGCRETTCRPAAGERVAISFDEAPVRETVPARGGGINKLLIGLLATTLLGLFILLFAYISLLSDRASAVDDESSASPGEADTEEAAQTFDADVIVALNADYYFDYKHGTIPIGDLYIGARVVDPNWEWEFRTGSGYTRESVLETRPVTWLVVAKDHYEGLQPHVTLLTEEQIGLFAFDDSTDRDHEYAKWGYSHWGESGTGNASHGLRPWLNSTGIHSGEGFYRAFSESFKQAVLSTTVLSREWEDGSAYSTQDKVFIPSTTELGDIEHRYTYPVGLVYPYFQGADDAKRVARLGGNAQWYWTRSPVSSGRGVLLRGDPSDGASYDGGADGGLGAFHGGYGVRPALNMKSEIMVSEIKP